MRLDKYLADRFGSRTKASAAISKGLVKINGKIAIPSYDFKEGDVIDVLREEENFVSLGGYKLSKALKDFEFSPKNKVFADIGASTGGFTHCLLKNGAKKIYCIDVGESQLAKCLISEKTIIIDNFNARNLNKELFSEHLDGVVIDVSFISLTYILKAVSDILEEGAEVIALIKPQFECESKKVGKNGIVKDRLMHEKIINKILDFAAGCGLNPVKITNAPIVKGKNMEYLLLMKKGINYKFNKELLIKSVKL